MGKHIRTKFKSRAQKRKYYQKLARSSGGSVDEVSNMLLNLSRFGGNRRIRRVSKLISVKPKGIRIVGWDSRRSFDQIWNEYEKKCHKWALDTVAVVKSLLNDPSQGIPSVVDGGSISDTGNLANSIGIVKEEYDKTSGKIHIRIGVNRGSGNDGIKAPPDWMSSPRYGHKRDFHKGEREMPYEDYSPYVIGKGTKKFKGYPVMQTAVKQIGGPGDKMTFSGGFGSPRIQRLLTDIAKENARKIILGK